MEATSRIAFTFRIYTEEPGSYLIACLNIPDFVIPCKEITKCIDYCRSHLGFLLTVGKQSLINEYSPTDFIDDGWHFQLIYNIEDCTCQSIYTGDKCKADTDKNNCDPSATGLINSHIDILHKLLELKIEENKQVFLNPSVK